MGSASVGPDGLHVKALSTLSVGHSAAPARVVVSMRGCGTQTRDYPAHKRLTRDTNGPITSRSIARAASQATQARTCKLLARAANGSARSARHDFGRGMGGHHTAGRGCCWMDGAVARRGPVAPPPVAPRRAGALAPKAMPPGRRPKPMHHGQSRLMANHQRTPSAVCERQIRSRLVVPVAAQSPHKVRMQWFLPKVERVLPVMSYMGGVQMTTRGSRGRGRSASPF
jgi:hypothetical protein